MAKDNTEPSFVHSSCNGFGVSRSSSLKKDSFNKECLSPLLYCALFDEIVQPTQDLSSFRPSTSEASIPPISRLIPNLNALLTRDMDINQEDKELDELLCDALDENCLMKGIGERIGFSFTHKQVNMAPYGSGILTVWDSWVFAMESQFVDHNFIAVIGTWAGISIKVGLLNVYAPQSSALKASLWFSIESLLSSYDVTWIVFGDFNVVRSREEHSRSGFNDREANLFNDFIARNGLFDFPFGGRKLFRFDKEGKKASKLDRFLVSQHFLDQWDNASVTVLYQYYSDHCLILLKVGYPNFGPKPFKVFEKWNIDLEFRKLVLDSWDAASSPVAPKISLKNKLKKLRLAIKSGSNNQAGLINEVDILKREEWMMDLNVLDQIQRDDFWQKFDFWNYIKLFEATGYISNGCNPSFVVLIPKKADPLGFSDYRPISLISCVYKVIAKLLSTWLARVIDSIIGPNQSAFVKGRQILDGCLMTNKIIRMVTLEDHKLLLFKVDFEKAFDSVNWEFLLVVIRQVGFGAKWSKWIASCLSSASILVLINGYLSKQFKMERGLWKGDPLSPPFFSFSSRSSSSNHFGSIASGLKVNIAKSRLYRVGVSRMNIDVVASSLGCDHGSLLFIYLRLLVGRKMNHNKGWNEVVNRIRQRLLSWKANSLSVGGRLTLIKLILGSLPIYYLSLFKAPKKVIELLESIRSKFFWGSKDSKRGISWVKWKSILLDKELGGLGVGCLHAKNLGLLDCMLSSPSNIERLVIDGFARMAFGVAIGLGVLLRVAGLLTSYLILLLVMVTPLLLLTDLISRLGLVKYQGVLQCLLWAIWKWRNKLVNSHLGEASKIKDEDIFSSIQRLSNTWISARLSLNLAKWDCWVARPFDLFL
ncbi:RNA-directed DNA polymerase, eukaryota [Tanacetum coccineum]